MNTSLLALSALFVLTLSSPNFANANPVCPGPAAASCTPKKGGACIEVTQNIPTLKKSCEGKGGKYAPLPCPKQAVISSCSQVAENGIAMITRYYAPVKPGMAQMICQWNKGEICD